MRRLLALIAAVAMIGVALIVRAGGEDESADQEQAEKLICAQELEDACNRLAASLDDVEVSVEPTAITATGLSGEDMEPPGVWLTLRPWPEIVEQDRARHSLPPATAKPSGVLARSPAVLVGVTERTAKLREHCRNRQLTWRCVGDHAGDPWTSVGGDETWGDIKVAHQSPDSGAGLVELGSAVSSYFGGRTPNLDGEKFQDWFERLERGVRPSGFASSSLVRDALQRPGTYDLVGALEADAGPLLARAAGRDRFTVFYPAPMASADVVAVAPAGKAKGALWDAVTGGEGARALAAAGWRVAGEPAADGVPAEPALPADDGLPSAGVLDALRGLWREVT